MKVDPSTRSNRPARRDLSLEKLREAIAFYERQDLRVEMKPVPHLTAPDGHICLHCGHSIHERIGYCYVTQRTVAPAG